MDRRPCSARRHAERRARVDTRPHRLYARWVPICRVCGFESAQAFKFCPECGAPVATAFVRERRKTVTVIFCDVTGSTALAESVDPEAVRALLAGYFERMKAIVEAHGGIVEKFIGDAVMAVFGVPAVHEDDALRSVRAAVEMRDAFADLGLTGRIGVNTGEVVAGTAERLATGDAVNIAARLEQAAESGEVLIGEATLRLVRDAVDVKPLEPLALKGNAKPVAAYRLLSAHEPTERLVASAMVAATMISPSCAPRWTRSSRTTPADCSRSSARQASASRDWCTSSSLGSR